MNEILFKADYASIERRLLACSLCEQGVPMNEVINTLVVKQTQVRFPRSKKSRIQKKWRKNPANFVSEPVIVPMGRSRLEAIYGKIIGVVGLPNHGSNR